MDVRLPDGRILRGVPDGTTKAEIEARVGAMPDPGATALPEQVSAPERVGIQATPEQPGKMSDFATATPNPDKWPARIPVDIGLGLLTGGGLTVASKLPWLAANAPRLASMLGYAGTSLTAPKTLTQLGLGGAIESGVTEAVQPDATPGSVLKSTAIGTVAAPLGQMVLGKATKPRIKTDPRAQRLIDQGVDVTTGGRIGPTWRKAEDKMVSTPFVGNSIVGAKLRERDSFNKMLVNDALDPLRGASTGKDLVPLKASKTEVPYQVPSNVEAGHGATIYADEQISKRYDDVLDNMVVVKDQQFTDEIANLRKMADRLPKSERREFNFILDEAFDTDISGGSDMLLGQTYKDVFRRIRDNSLRYSKSTDGFQQNLGSALHETAMSLKELGIRQNPIQAPRLRDVDEAYAKMETLRGAIDLQGSEDGLVNANQYLSQVRKKATGKRYSQGRAFNQEIAEDARAVMAQKVPNSGTADRIAALGLLGGGAVASGTMLPALAGAGAGVAAYSKPGQKALNRFLFDNPEPMKEGIRKSLDPIAGLLTSATATEYERARRRKEEDELMGLLD